MAKTILFVCGVNLKVENKQILTENKDKRLIYAANHSSIIDFIVIYTLIEGDFDLLVFESGFNMPIIGFIFREIGGIPAARTLDKDRLEHNLSDIAVSLSQYSILIFPEGKLSQNGELQTFRRGIGEIAKRSQRAVLPIILRGSFAILPPPKHKIVGSGIWFFSYALFWLGSIFNNFHPGIIRATVKEPIMIGPEENGSDFVERVRKEFVLVMGS